VVSFIPEENTLYSGKYFIINKKDKNEYSTKWSYLEDFFSDRKNKLLRLKDIVATNM
jgi:hypothetical protein